MVAKMIIPDDKVAEGMSLYQDNVERLMRDVNVLHRNKSYGHALSSVMFAYDEYTKIIILFLNKVPDVNTERIHKLTFSRLDAKYTALSATIVGSKEDIIWPDGKSEKVHSFLSKGFKHFREIVIYVNYDENTNS